MAYFRNSPLNGSVYAKLNGAGTHQVKRLLLARRQGYPLIYRVEMKSARAHENQVAAGETRIVFHRALTDAETTIMRSAGFVLHGAAWAGRSIGIPAFVWELVDAGKAARPARPPRVAPDLKYEPGKPTWDREL